MSAESNKAVILHELEVSNAAFRSMDWIMYDKMMDETYTEDTVHHDLSQGKDMRGRETNKQSMRRLLKTHPNVRYSLPPDHLIAEGDMVTGLWRLGGTDPATGMRGGGVCSKICRFAGGKVAEAWQLTALEEAQK